MKIKRLKASDPFTVKLFNSIIDRLNLLSNIRGRNGVSAHLTSGGVSIRGSSNKNDIHLAYAKAAAGAASTIDCYLDVDETGTEVTVTCSISGGTTLNSAIPRLDNGDLIFVTQIGGTWYCLTTFQATEDCVCS